MGRRKILVIEDEKQVLDLVAKNLTREGFDVFTSRTGGDGLRFIRESRPDLIILDVMLPDVDGLELCRQLKWNPETRALPVVMVTAKAEESDIVLGLGIGADDYIPKPFRLKELIARVKAVLRRAYVLGASGDERRLKTASLMIDLDRHLVLVKGESIRLTPTEIRLLHFLASSPGVVLSREQLITCVGQDPTITGRIIDVHIQAIRRKLGKYRDMIDTIRGVGYRYVEI